VEALEPARRAGGEGAVEARALLERAVDQLGGEPAIRVAEAGARELAGERQRRVGALLDAREHAPRDVAGGGARAHRPSTVPIAIGRPASSAAAPMRLRPGSCSS